MARVDNLDQDLTRSLIRRIEALERATPGSNMSIGRNGLRLYGGGRITIENNGGITITGPDGELIGSGTLEWTGPANLRGDTAITGTLNVTGNSAFGGTLDILGDTDISGNTVVEGTLNVVNSAAFGANVDIVSPGRLAIGSITLDPIAGPGGSGLISSAVSIQVNTPTLAAQNAIFAGGDITANGSVIAGGITGKGGVTANVYVDGSGKLFRVI